MRPSGGAVVLAGQRLEESDEVEAIVLGKIERKDRRRATRAVDAAPLVELDDSCKVAADPLWR